MTTMKFRATVELNYQQMTELLFLLAIRNTTDQELNDSLTLYGDYGTYNYKIDKNGNVLVLKVEKKLWQNKILWQSMI